MAGSFAAAVGAWASKSEERLEAVRNRAIELLAEEMIKTKPNGGRLPFETGNLARSILASTQGLPNTSEGPFPGSNVGLVTANLRLDQPAWIGFQAAYARRMEFGFVGADSLGRVYNQEGSHFVTGAIAEWANIVKKAVSEVQSTSQGAS